MSLMSVGKTKINLDADGCTKCGTRWSHDWGEFKSVDVAIGKRVFKLSIPICGDCMDVEYVPQDDNETSAASDELKEDQVVEKGKQ